MKKVILVFILLSICTNAQTLSNMYFLNKNIGWIQTVDSTDTPLISYRTTNGGITWVQLDDQYKYQSIQFINDSVGYLLSGTKLTVVFVGDKLYKTTDKGETWQFLEDSLAQVEFANENVGYASCYTSRDGAYIYKTTDGGVNWENTKERGDLILKALTKNKVAIFYEHGHYFKLSSDFGETWNSIMYIPDNYNYNIYQAVFTDSMHGFATIDAQYQRSLCGDIRKTTDGGLTWTGIDIDQFIFLSMADSLNGVLFRGSYYDINHEYFTNYYITHDGFTTWEKKFSNSLTRYYLYKGCKEFYTCGDSGYFAKSTDCGDTWTEIPFNVINSTDPNDNQSVNSYSLQQNYPNPFNPTTRINYNLQSSGFTTIKVYDVLGKEIVTLLNDHQTSGSHYMDFNAAKLTSGVYFYKINSGGYTEVKKMLLLK